MPLQVRAKVGGGWGRVLAGGWVKWLVILSKVLRKAQGELGRGSVVGLLPVAHGVPSYVGLAGNLVRDGHSSRVLLIVSEYPVINRKKGL